MKKKNSIIVMLLVAILFIYTLGISDIKEIKKNSDYSSIFVASYYSTNRL